MKTIGSIKIVTSVDPTVKYGKVAVIKTHAKTDLVDGGTYSKRIFANFRIVLTSATNIEFADVSIRARTGLTKDDNTAVIKTNGGTQIEMVVTYEFEKVVIYLKAIANAEQRIEIDSDKSKYVKGIMEVSEFVAMPSTSILIPITKI